MSGIGKQNVTLAGALALLALSSVTAAQFRQEPGRSIGTITTQGHLIVLTLDQDVLGKANLFDLAHHSLRFTPDGSGYRVETVASQWDPAFGAELPGSDASLKNFAFPFSGKTWTSFSVGVTGSITFGEAPVPAGRPTIAEPNHSGGLAVDRFAELQQAGPALINTVPAISVFFKPRLSGKRYLKESADRAVITWSLTEPTGGIQDMSWTPTVNRFQAVLHKDGTIEFNYDDVHAEDAIVGLYPVISAGNETEIAHVTSAENDAVAAHLDIKNIKLTAVDGLFFKVTLETRGPVLAENDPAIAGLAYRVCLDREKPTADCAQDAGMVWTIFGGRGRGGRARGGAPVSRYFAFGPGLLPAVKVNGNSISMQGTLPADYKSGDRIFLSAAVQTAGTPPVTVDRVAPQPVRLTGLASPEVHLSSLKKSDGPFPVVFETIAYFGSAVMVERWPVVVVQ